MARIYSTRTVFASRFLETLAYIFLFPFILLQRPRSSNAAFGNVLLVEPFQIGDVLSLTPLISPLKSKYPRASIYVLTKNGGGTILDFDSRITQTFTTDFPWSDHGTKKFSLTRTLASVRYAFSLRKYGFDLGIDTRGDIRSQILLILTGCKTRLGYMNYLHSNVNLNGKLLTHKPSVPTFLHRYEWNTDLLTSIGFAAQEIFPIDFPCFTPDKISLEVENAKFVLLHVGGGWEFRRWSEEKWIALIHYLQHLNYESIQVVGGVGEKDILTRIGAGLNSLEKVEFKVTSLSELVMLIARCGQFISLDSGPMNIAACMNKNIIALFGPGDASMWRPLNPRGRYIQKVDNFPCSPCLQMSCLFPKRNCMHEIEVVDVIDSIVNKNSKQK